MALMQPPICDLGWNAQDFSLPATDGRTYSLNDIAGTSGTLIIFICNHCPYVRGIITRLVDEVKELQALGIGVAAVMPNDTVAYPADDFEHMKRFAEENNFSFPYLWDETQEVGRAYGAVCTPDFFGFNKDLELQYRGRMDASRTSLVEGAERELFNAMRQVAETGKGPERQIASMGCSIKWRAAS